MCPSRERLPEAGGGSNFSLTTQTHSTPGHTLFKGSNSIKWLRGSWGLGGLCKLVGGGGVEKTQGVRGRQRYCFRYCLEYCGPEDADRPSGMQWACELSSTPGRTFCCQNSPGMSRLPGKGERGEVGTAGVRSSPSQATRLLDRETPAPGKGSGPQWIPVWPSGSQISSSVGGAGGSELATHDRQGAQQAEDAGTPHPAVHGGSSATAAWVSLGDPAFLPLSPVVTADSTPSASPSQVAVCIDRSQ